MRKLLKWLLIAVIALVVLVLAAAILVPILFKDRIEQAVKDEVNANLNAQVDWGDWDITLLKSFPDLTVEVTDVAVCNRAPFEGICLARIGTFTATIDIKSLWRDQVEVLRVGLVRPNIHVKVLEDGRANWDIALADTSAVEETSASADTASAFNVGLKEYWIEDGHLVYDDATLPMRMDLAGLDHRGEGDFTQDLFTLSTTTHADSTTVVFDGVKYLRRANVDLKADLEMDLPNMKFTFQENEAVVNQLALGFDGWLAMPADDIDMDLTWDLKRNDLATILSLVPAEFATDLDGVDMSGNVAFNGYVKGTYNETSMPGFGLTIGVDNGRFKYPDLPESVEDIFVDCTINSPGGADMDGMVVDLRRFAMQLAQNPVEARLHLTHPTTDPDLDASLRASVDLGSLKRVVPMEAGDELSGSITANVALKGRMSAIEQQRYKDFTAEGELILLDMVYRSDSLPYPVGIESMYFGFSPQYLKLDRYEGTIGRSDLQANGRFDNYLQWWLQDSTLAGSFTVRSNKFDLNELMGPEEEATAEGGETVADSSSMSVIEVPKNIDFRMSAEVQQVIYDDMTLADCKGDLHVHDQRVELRDLFFRLFGGTVTMNGDYDTQDPSVPRFDLGYDVNGLDIAETVKYVETVQQVAPIAKTCTGRFSTDLTMSGVLGGDMMPDLNSLVGKGRLTTQDVDIKGFQPLVDLAKALKIAEVSSTTIEDVDFTYRFQDGKMITDPFDVKIDKVQARVGGSTAFEDQAIDYDMTAKVPSEVFGAAANQFVAGLLGQANQAVGGNLQVPEVIDLTVKMTGTIDKPVVKPVFAGGTSSVKEAVEEQVKEVVNEEIDKAKEEAIARAREEADRLVAEAQKQADQIKADARKEAARVKGEAYAAADKLVADASNPFAKAAAQVAAQKLKEEADKKEQQFIAEADKRADGIVASARAKGDDLIRKAEATDTKLK